MWKFAAQWFEITTMSLVYMYVFRIDVSAVQGQKSEVTVILRGLSLPKTVRCFSSCPEQLVVF